MARPRTYANDTERLQARNERRRSMYQKRDGTADAYNTAQSEYWKEYRQEKQLNEWRNRPFIAIDGEKQNRSYSMSVDTTLTKYPHIADSYKDITEHPFKCPNCNTEMGAEGTKEIYCSPQCKEMAKHIRYERKCRADGRYELTDVQDAIRTKIAFLLSDAGYYDSKARTIPDDVRKTVIERDKVCVLCGKEANEIDHISGDSYELDNLQLLCHDCHTIKTQANFVPYIMGTDERKDHIIEEYKRRAQSQVPEKLCDTDEWGSLWREVIKARKMNYYGIIPK